MARALRDKFFGKFKNRPSNKIFPTEPLSLLIPTDDSSIQIGNVGAIGEERFKLARLLNIDNPNDEHLKYIAPASGLILNKIDFEN